MPVWVATLILAALAVLAAAWWLILHVGPLLGVLVIVGAVYYLGRRHESKRPRIGQASAPKQATARTSSPRTPAGWKPPKLAKLTPVMVSKECASGQCAICPGAAHGCEHDCGHEPHLIVARNRALAEADNTDPPF